MEQKKLYLVREYREEYSLWITMFYGQEQKEVVYVGNGSIKIDCDIHLDKIIIDKKINGNIDFGDIINIDMTKLKAYDGKRVYSDVIEITKEQSDVIIKRLEKNDIDYSKEYWNEKMKEIENCYDVDEFMKNYYSCMNSINSTFDIALKTYMCETLSKSIEAFHDNMHKIAIKENKKQCIYRVNGSIDEQKGMRIIREYILPNGKTEKVNGWEYELNI